MNTNPSLSRAARSLLALPLVLAGCATDRVFLLQSSMELGLGPVKLTVFRVSTAGCLPKCSDSPAPVNFTRALHGADEAYADERDLDEAAGLRARKLTVKLGNR